jgi:hypothetical protein
MIHHDTRQFVALDDLGERDLIESARCSAVVSGLTHCFYKYPARFSPAFARATIKTFTRPGDLVLDNHVGGGTSLVEAVAAGRNALGIDISSLAEFVSEVKTTVCSDSELDALDRWARRVPFEINIHRKTTANAHYEALGYFKHLDGQTRWRVRRFIEQVLASAERLDNSRLEAFGRCAALRLAQWALDGRKDVPTTDEMRQCLTKIANEMVVGAVSFRNAVANCPDKAPRVRILNRSAIGMEGDPAVLKMGPPRLVLTSPPYPGVHVLYHRWQVDGGKEVPAPFWIAGKLNGAGSSYYTMGDRKFPELRTYFDNITRSMASVAAISDKSTIIVQMVAFSDASWQLRKYLEAMQAAGLSELFLSSLQSEADGRLWRKVPRRKWYSQKRGETPSTLEVVLFFKKTSAPPSLRPVLPAVGHVAKNVI